MEHDRARGGSSSGGISHGDVASPSSALLGATVNQMPATAGHSSAPWRQPQRNKKTAAALLEGEAASPPPRPPKPNRSRSHSCNRDDATAAAAPACLDDYTTPMLQCTRQPLHHEQRDANGSSSVGAPTVLRLRSEDAVTPERGCRPGGHDALVDFTAAPSARSAAATVPTGAGRSERTSAAATAAATMLGTSVQLMEATTMSLSPSVHRPATSLRMATTREAGAASAWDREPSDSLEHCRPQMPVAEAGVGADPLARCVAPVARECVRVDSAIEVSAGGRSAAAGMNAAVQPVPSTSALSAASSSASGSNSDSDDEDEKSLFRETVLFMNNTLQSLGSTRRTPSKPTLSHSQHHPSTHANHHPSHEAVGSASPTPHLPCSLEVTPGKTSAPPRHASDSSGRPDRAERSETVLHASLDDSGSEPPSAGRDVATTAAMLRAATGLLLPTTQPHHSSPSTTAPVSPAMTANTHAPVPTPHQLFRSDLELAASSSSTGALEAATRPESLAAASEYIFINNHDGTAYLADASLQLDGSYALGETILLARSDAAAVAGLSQRQHVPRAGARDTAAAGGGAASPVVVPQSAAEMPQQRANAAHRPLRGAQLPVAPPAPAPFSPGSPVPRPVAARCDTPRVTPVSPSIARVLVRRSAAPSRDASVRPGAGGPGSVSHLLPSTFSESFCFNQTLLVPMEPTRRSPAVARGSGEDAESVNRLDGSASAAVRMADSIVANPAARRGALVYDASFALSEQSYRSSAVPRWDSSYASPVVLMPPLSSPAVSFRAFQAGATGVGAGGCRREGGVARPSPSCEPSLAASSVYSPMYPGCVLTRASPVPDVPCPAEQRAQQEARATRETRAVRPDHDVIYLIPAGAATATVSADDIARQGWIPVQMVVDTPPPAQPASSARRDGQRARSYIVGGRSESPLPKNPALAAAAAAGDGCMGHEADAEEELADDVESVEREPSLSRRSHVDGAAAAAAPASPTFSPASTLSATTLDCINRRLSYSMSHWASTRQRFGAAEASFAGSVALPPATPLNFAVFAVSPVPQAGGGSGVGDAAAVAVVMAGREGRGCATGLEPTSDSRSPLPLPPGSPELPQREQSPSRCADTSGSTPARCAADLRGDGRGATELYDTGYAEDDSAAVLGGVDRRHVDPSSLLTSMSFQRPSTTLTGASESYAQDGSFSIPLTSSASMSLGLGARHPYGGVGGGGAGHPRQHGTARQTPLQQQPLQLRAPHPRRMSANAFINATPSSASVSMQMFGEGSNLALQGGAVPMAGNTSFRTTFCNHRSGAASVGGGSLNLAAGDGGVVTASAGGLPLSRGTLGTPTSAAAPRGAHTPASTPVVHRGGAARAHPYAGPQQHLQQAQRAATSRVGAAGQWATGGRRTVTTTTTKKTTTTKMTATSTATSGARVAGRIVPDTSVFLPWAPLTITPDGSLNLGGEAEATHLLSLPYHAMTLMPFTSSGETSMMTTTTTITTTTTTTCEETHRQDEEQHALPPPVTVQAAAPREAAARHDRAPRSAVSHMAAAMLRTAANNRQPPSATGTATTASHPTSDTSGGNAVGFFAMTGMSAAAAAAAAAAGVGAGHGGFSTAVNKDAFVSSFLQHAASQAPTSVEGSLNEASVFTTTTSHTKSVAPSRASMLSSATHMGGSAAWEGGGVGDGHAASLAAAMEATMNQFQASLFGASTAAESEPEPRAPSFPGTPPSTTATATNTAAAVKENFPAAAAPCHGRVLVSPMAAGGALPCLGRRSESNGATRGAGLREGSAANVAHAIRLSGKTRSPSYRAHHADAVAPHAVPPPPPPA